MEGRKQVRSLFGVILLITGLFTGATLSAQENPPFPAEVEVRNAQGLNFGAFTVGTNGGEIQMSPEGERTAIGDIFLLNTSLFGSPTNALFDVYANPGTLLQVLPEEVPLAGPNSNCLTLSIDPSFDIRTHNLNGSYFITSSNPQAIYLGGTLIVAAGCSNYSGSYSGTFNLTLIHE